MLNLNPHKKVLAVTAVLMLLCLAAAAIGIALDGGGGRTPPPAPPGGPSPAGERTRVAFKEEAPAGGLLIRLLPDTAGDGSLVYQVEDGQGKAIGTFSYIPWQGKNPLFRELPGGDLILGSQKRYRAGDRKIHELGEGTGLGCIFDYAVHDNLLVLIGNSGRPDDAAIHICAVDLGSGASKPVDEFRYPDYLSLKDVHTCWAGGRFYYDCCLGDRAMVKAYDPVSGQSPVFKEGAMGPVASPDGRYLALFAPDAPAVQKGIGVGLEVLDLESGRVTGLEGSNRVFWSNGYVTVWDGDRLQLHVYDLNSGIRIKDAPADSPVAGLSIDNGILGGFEYHFENRQITREQFQVNLGANNGKGSDQQQQLPSSR